MIACPSATVTVPLVAPPIADKSAAVSLEPVIVTASLPRLDILPAAYVVATSAAVPVTVATSVALTVTEVTPLSVFRTVAARLVSETVTVLAAPRTTFVPDVTRAAVA